MPRRSVVALLLVSALAGCGGGSKPSTTSTQAGATAQITSVWTTFFDGAQSNGRAALLQNGGAFSGALSKIAASPVAHGLSATVSKVVLHGANSASVTYTIYLDKNPVLKNVTGTAVRVGGHWLVGVASFCRLVALEGATPAACSSG